MNEKFYCFLIIKVEPKYAHDVFNRISKIEQTHEIHPLFGNWQLICQIDTKTEKEYSEILDEIKSLKGVTETKILMGFNLKEWANGGNKDL